MRRYRKVASSNTSCLEAHAGISRLLMKGIFDAYVLLPFDKKNIFELVTRVSTRDYTVCIEQNLKSYRWVSFTPFGVPFGLPVLL